MDSASNQKTQPLKKDGALTGRVSGRRFYAPGVREPYQLPTDKIVLPAPPRLPNPPVAFSWLSIIPPALMAGLMVGMPLISGQAVNPVMFVPMVASLGFPVINLINAAVQKRQYAKNLRKRTEEYQSTLERERGRLKTLAESQRVMLEAAHPKPDHVIDLGLAGGQRERLWWRRPQDSDFVGLRIGLCKAASSFTVQLPSNSDPFDELPKMAEPIVQEFREIPDIPFLVDLKKVGSVGVVSNRPDYENLAVQRLLLDLIVHHSPAHVGLYVVADTSDVASRWSWLKWAPHTHALRESEKIRHINFAEGQINDFVSCLAEQFQQRERASNQNNNNNSRDEVIVVVFNDRGYIRQRPDLKGLVERGHQVGIYTLFMGAQNLPSVRCRLDISDMKGFRYMETWEGGMTVRGQAELVTASDNERVARSLAQLELLGDKSSYELPESIRLSQVLTNPVRVAEDIQQNWTRNLSDRELLQFPIGITIGRDGPSILHLNLLPAERGGQDAYHTILIGYTGSGKSEFLKSLVLGAAVKYSPQQLCFFTLDFKGGSTFNSFSNLPHMVGIVDNLGPELVERGLDAIQNEIDHRLKVFADSQAAKDIWIYNKRNPNQPLPHLLLVLDEFARGLKEFPRLKEILDLLVRQGRSLGMYLILANQDISSALDNLLANVGWRIALKVGKLEDLNFISKEKENPNRAGNGYLRSSQGDIFEFQAGYAGKIILSASSQSQDEFVISQVELNGNRKLIYRHKTNVENRLDNKDVRTEQEAYLAMIDEAARALNIPRSTPIYSDPLPTTIRLDQLLVSDCGFRCLQRDGYTEIRNHDMHLKIPIGYIDFPERCVQQPLILDFADQDTHLWISGALGTGKSMTVKTILTALALTHTPEEVNFYILEFGSGDLRSFETLPHTGAVINTNENERIQRLLTFLENEVERRTAANEEDSGSFVDFPKVHQYAPNADVFLVINNFAEFNALFPDDVEKIQRLVGNGKAARIHLIITANRSADLPRKVSSGIARRLVFRMSQRDEYQDVLNMAKNHPTQAMGRGYWKDNVVAESQIAQPFLDEILKRGEQQFQSLIQLVKYAQQKGNYLLPKPVISLPRQEPLIKYIDWLKSSEPRLENIIPLGLDYLTLEPIGLSLLKELPRWMVISPVARGKSNVLALFANSITALDAEKWDIFSISFKRDGLSSLFSEETRSKIRHAPSTKALEMLQVLKSEVEKEDEYGRHVLVLLDDLPGAFDNAATVAALEAFSQACANKSDIILVASAMRDELIPRNSSPTIRSFKQNQTGIILSNDTMDLDWLGVQGFTTVPYRRIEFSEGGGFLVRKAKIRPIQIFMTGSTFVKGIK